MPVLTLSARAGAVDMPALDEEETRVLVERYKDLVTQLTLAHRDWPGWWYSWLSSRDRHNSRVLDAILSVARARRLLALSPIRDQHLALADPLVAAKVEELAREMGWTVRTGAGDRVRWMLSRIDTAAAPLLGVAKLLRHGIRGTRAARRRAHAPGALIGIQRLIVTILDRGALPHARKEFTDTYFGTLPALLAGRGVKTLILGQPMSDERGEIAASVAAWHHPSVCTPHHLTGFSDVVASAFRAAHMPPVSAPADAEGVWLARVIRADLRRDTVSRGFGFLIERAVARTLERNRDASILHMYENNPWERAVAKAAHAARPRRDVTGYLHCAVLPAHLKNYLAPEEAGLRPAPDRIVCTGPAAREVFLGLGAHDPARVAAGCALRDAGLQTLAPRLQPPRRVRTLLVLLEGLEKMVGLLRFADAAARLCPNIRFVVREHPALGLARLAPLARVALGGPVGLQVSRAATLVEALAEADAVLYQGTTAAMNAGAAGIPLLRFRGNEVPTDDPLFACSALKREVGAPDDVPAALGHFTEMEDATWQRELATFRAYVLAYLAPANGQNLAPFDVPVEPAGEAAYA
jgi:hypothetical protein